MATEKIRVAVCRSALKLEEFLNRNVLAENIIQITHCINGSGAYAVDLYTVIYYDKKKMMDRASQITGIDITPVHEEEMRKARMENQAQGIYLRRRRSG